MFGKELEQRKYKSTTAGGAALAAGTGLKMETQVLTAAQHSSVWSHQTYTEPSKHTAPLPRALKASEVTHTQVRIRTPSCC